MKQKVTGKIGERSAMWYLKARGYTILQTNYHTRLGEIDIIARKNKTVVFIEVKTRSTLTGGLPEEAVTPLKLEKFQAAVDQYLLNQPPDIPSIRIDVISINLATATRSKITHFKNISFDA